MPNAGRHTRQLTTAATKMEAAWSDWWMIAVSIVAAVAVIWLILAVALLLAKPKGVGMRDVLRLLPDLVRLVEHLATDREMPRRIRTALALVLAFMASPIDVIPDFIPVIGMADDVVLVALVLRWITRTAGPAALTKHWLGTPEGLNAVRRACGLSQPD